MRAPRTKNGFTLLEMLLVLVIMATILAMIIGFMQQKTREMRINKTVMDMQQILNAALSFYVANGRWPGTVCKTGICSPTPPFSNSLGDGICALTQAYYLPSPMLGAYGKPFSGPCPDGSTITTAYSMDWNSQQAWIWTYLTSNATMKVEAQRIAAQLPLGYLSFTGMGYGHGQPPNSIATACTPGTGCLIVTSVNVPAQNLNNATAINFAGVYHNGGCIPVPECPLDKNGTLTTPEVIVVPLSVSGVNDVNSPNNIYPISSFTAYAVGPSAGGGVQPAPCNGYQNFTSTACQSINPSDKYWRACLQVITLRGEVAATNQDWGRYVYLGAFTRCAPTNEPSGSPLTSGGTPVYSR